MHAYSKGIIRAHRDSLPCPPGLIVPSASVPSAELCFEDTVANTKGKRKKRGGTKSEMADKWTWWLYNTCRVHGSPTHRLAWIASP